MNDSDEQHLLTGAYALNALNEQDKAGFEEYLEGSEEARTEAAALSDTAVRLALTSEPVTPSPRLKESLMAAIRTTPQLAAEPSAETSSRAEPLPDGASPSSSGPALSAASGMLAPTPLSSARRRARALWYTRPVAILAAAAAAVALFAGGNWLGQSTASNTAVQAQATALVQLSAAGDVQRASGTVAGGGTATVIWSLRLQRAAVVIDKLPALAAGKTYQLWYIDAAGAKPAGTFDSNDGGTTWHLLDGTMSQGDTIGVTVEPDGGSAKPTTKPILAIATA